MPKDALPKGVIRNAQGVMRLGSGRGVVYDALREGADAGLGSTRNREKRRSRRNDWRVHAFRTKSQRYVLSYQYQYMNSKNDGEYNEVKSVEGEEVS